MNRSYILTTAVILLTALAACSNNSATIEAAETSPAAATPSTEEDSGLDIPESNYYEIATPVGSMVIRLYDETPAHRDNFKKLVAEGFYDGTRFHRVIEGFMIQGGDPNSKDDDPMNDGAGGPGYTVEAEFNKAFFHKRGALAAARQADQVNPQRRSSGSQFYIVHGTPQPAEALDQMQMQMAASVPGFSFSDEARQAYQEVGGAPFLDMQYTVFGEVVEGFDTIDKIASSDTPKKRQERVHPALADQPATPITITVRSLPDYVETSSL